MELYIETLTGTAFELRVTPFETIMSIKAKIQRLEGIPISQQHLIWQSRELEDEFCLQDYSITDGATLKLVLAMRGGPINARRVPLPDDSSMSLREITEYVEANRDEIWEKLPGNRQVTLLVFREGDQLNFFRVVDRGDGTLTPLSESLSGTAVCNYLEEDDEEEEEEEEVETESLHKVAENEETRSKMRALRSKMECMTLTKKPSSVRRKPRPPSAGRPLSRDGRHRARRASGRLRGNGGGGQWKLPPVGTSYTASESSNASGEDGNAADTDGDCEQRQRLGVHALELGSKVMCASLPSNLSGSLADMLEAVSSSTESEPDAPTAAYPGGSAAAAMRARHISRYSDSSDLSQLDSDPGPPKVAAATGAKSKHKSIAAGEHAVKRKQGGAGEKPRGGRATRDDEDVAAGTAPVPRPGSAKVAPPVGGVRVASWRGGRLDAAAAGNSSSNTEDAFTDSGVENTSSGELSGALSRSLARYSLRGRSVVSPGGASATAAELKLIGSRLDPRLRLQPISAVDAKPKDAPQPPPTTTQQQHKSVHRGAAAASDHRKLELVAAAGGRRGNELPSIHARLRRESQSFNDGGGGGMARGRLGLDKRKESSLDSLMAARLERADSAAAAAADVISKASSLDTLRHADAPRTSGALVRAIARDNLSSSKIGLSGSQGSIHHASTMPSLGRMPTAEGRLLSARLQQQLCALQQSEEKAALASIQRLPPVKTRKASRRCFFCNRKTGIASSYVCRCGNNFCSSHRYAETHACTHDYKSEGRRLLQEANPIVVAPKLPRI